MNGLFELANFRFFVQQSELNELKMSTGFDDIFYLFIFFRTVIMFTISAHITRTLCILAFFLQHAVYYKVAYLCKQNHMIWVDQLEFAYKIDFSSDSSQSNRVVGIFTFFQSFKFT